MALVTIQGGTSYIGASSYLYEYVDNDGLHRLFFTASSTPIIGDSIDTTSGMLVPRNIVAAPDNPLSPSWPEPIINNDPGFQSNNEVDHSWPEPYKG